MTVILQYEDWDTHNQILAVVPFAAGLKAAQATVRCALQGIESTIVLQQEISAMASR